MKNPIALISGGASGIGYDLSKCFAADGYSLIIISRNEANLREAKLSLQNKYQVDVETITADLSDIESIPSIFKKIKDQGIQLDALVNNAGFGLLGNFTDLDTAKQLNMIDLNVKALTYMTRLFLDQAPKNAKILNVASMAAYLPGPLMNVYYASKAYVLSFSEALAEELKERKITVTVLCPGPVATNFWKVSNPSRTTAPDVKMMTQLSSEVVAQAGYQGLLRGRQVVIPGVLNRLLIFTNKFLPRSLLNKIVKKINQKF